LKSLPEEAGHLANIEYNFGLHAYEGDNKEKSLEWLLKSLETRKLGSTVKFDKVKQAITMRLAGICFLSLDKVDEARKIMTAAEELHHDSVGAYLLLKIAIIDRSSDVPELLNGILSDPESSESTLELAMSAIGLMSDSDNLQNAVGAYKTIWQSKRFTDDLIVGKVAPRYFEALTALGSTAEALKLLEEVFNILEKLPRISSDNDASETLTTEPDHYQRWAVIALQAGCGFANRKDYHSATVLLDKALRISAKSKPDKALDSECNYRCPLIENEVAACRLLASCAISYVKSLKGDNAESDGESNLSRQDALETAKIHVLRALKIDEEDFSSRLLLFRIRLLENQPEIAASEIQKASSETVYFDALGLAEAAIYAGEADESAAVIASLKCILDVSPEAMRKSLVESEKKPQDGFLGTVFVAYMKMMIKEYNQESGGEDEDEFCIPGELLANLHDSMRIGYRFMQELGVEVVFGKDSETKEAALRFLGAVAWNCGRRASICKMYDLWTSFFDMCHDFNKHRMQNEDSDNSMLISRMMAATALLFVEPQDLKDYDTAKERLSEAKRMCEEQNLLGEHPLNSKIALLQAKCFVGMGDDDSLACLADITCHDSKMSTEVLVDLALLCRDGERYSKSNGSDSKARRNDMCCSLLNVCVDRMLAQSGAEIAHIAHVLRELILSEIGRGEAGNKAIQAFSRASGLLKEKGEDYPRDERRWLVGMAWDRSEMLMISNRMDEALVWVKMGIEVASPDNGLATYVPKLEKLKEKVLKAIEEANRAEKAKTQGE